MSMILSPSVSGEWRVHRVHSYYTSSITSRPLQEKLSRILIRGNIIIEDSKELSGLYRCSDLLLTAPRPSKVFIRCDAEGYFFQDKEVTLVATSDQQIMFNLERIGKGKSFQIEEIEFKPGTSEIMPES